MSPFYPKRTKWGLGRSLLRLLGIMRKMDTSIRQMMRRSACHLHTPVSSAMITPSLRDQFNLLLSDEAATVVPITVQVVNSFTLLDPTSTEVPEPTRVRLNDTITGEPFTATPTPTTTESLSSSISSDPQIGGKVSINRGFTWWSILAALALSLVFH
jgi:hypothetical protein